MGKKLIIDISEFLSEDYEGFGGGDHIDDIHSFVGMSDEELNEVNLDVFELIKEKTMQVAFGYGNSLIITGQSGLGKTHDVTGALKQANLQQGSDYVFNAGNISEANLFEELFLNHDKLLVFDDCDSVFKDVNTLKSALDSKPERIVTRKLKSHFGVTGMSMNDILANYTGDRSMADNKSLVSSENKGKLPKQFTFTGRVIFISNLKQKQIDPALITRATASIDVDLTHEEVLERLEGILKFMKPEVSDEMKREVLNLVDYLTMNFQTRHPLSIRTVVNAINTRVSNDKRYKEVNGKKYPLWQLMIKQDLVGKKAVRRSDEG
jgi:hypothetical protein